MTPEQWQKLEEVLQGALDVPPQDRASFIDEACAGDERLLEEASSLVNAHEAAGDFIEEPALTRDASVLVGSSLDEKIGSEIGPYRILQRLGVGGMGVVYLAQDTRLERLVALKILPAYFASDDARLRRFQREARAASSLNHPNIITIHEVGECDGVYFIATEFIDGETIRELAAERQLSLAEISSIAEQVASALAAAHAEGIVHRDIKPENIMRRSDGLVKILDFGIAKLMEPESADPQSSAAFKTQTEAGLVMGTVSYMSPEQARGLPVDKRSDVWSFGVVLYDMLAQRLPFSGATRMDTIVAILDREPASLSESGKQSQAATRLKRIIRKCLCKDVNERYQTADELLAELKSVDTVAEENYLALSETAEKAKLDNGASSVTFLRHHAFAAMVLLVVLASVAAIAVVYRRTSSPPAASSAVASSDAKTDKLYTHMNDAEQLMFVKDQEQRISAMMGDRPAKLNDDALRAIKLYIDRRVYGVKPDTGESLNDIYGRAPQYVPLIARSFQARKVPIIIGIYLPMIESAYRPCFENDFGSKGLFQFLPQTARLYGVSRDEMCDVKR